MRFRSLHWQRFVALLLVMENVAKLAHVDGLPALRADVEMLDFALNGRRFAVERVQFFTVHWVVPPPQLSGLGRGSWLQAPVSTHRSDSCSLFSIRFIVRAVLPQCQEEYREFSRQSHPGFLGANSIP